MSLIFLKQNANVSPNLNAKGLSTIIVGTILAKMDNALILRMIINVSVNLAIKEKIVIRRNVPMAWLEKIAIRRNVEMAMLEKIVICLVQSWRTMPCLVQLKSHIFVL